jgi:hypothetical protein
MSGDTTSQSFRVRPDAGPLLSTSGRKSRWGHLPLSEIEVDDVIELPMSATSASSVIPALSSYVWRQSKRLQRKFSVKRITIGIGICRIK